MKKRFSFLLIGILLALSLLGATPVEREPFFYDAESALNFARKYVFWSNWGNCAEFASRCLEAGGMEDIFSDGCTTLHRKLSAYPELTEYRITFGKYYNIPIGELADILTPGDIGIYQCLTCEARHINSYVHAFIYSGVDQNGYLRAYSHNPCENPAKPYWYDKTCYDCGAVLHDIVFFHFPMLTGWQNMSDGRTYFTETGSRAKGILEIDGICYAFDKDGHPFAGWSSTFGGYALSRADGRIIRLLPAAEAKESPQTKNLELSYMAP